MSAVVVTGGTGMVGHALVRALLPERRLVLVARGHDGVSPSRRLVELIGPELAAALRAGQLEIVEGDTRAPRFGLDRAAWHALARRVGAVVHLAARTDFSAAHVSSYRPDNVRAAGHAARLAALAGCDLHHVSTAYVSGTHGGVFRECDHGVGQAFHNGYEQSKWEAEALVRRIAGRRGGATAILRLALVLPDQPVTGVPTGPGPLAYLRQLIGLEGRAGVPARVVRSAGHPGGLLNAVPLAFAVEAIRRSIARGAEGFPVYHVTAARSLRMDEIAAALGAALRGIDGRIVAAAELADLDPFERVLERRMRVYRPYRFLTTTYERARLESELGLWDDGVTPHWLSAVLDRHACAWRAQSQPAAPPAPVEDYFLGFLRSRLGLPLVPGLASLDATFSVSVRGGPRFRVCIARGVLDAVDPTDAPADSWDYETDAESFLAAVEGRRRAAELFFDQRIDIRGDVHSALSTALVLEEFFATHPYRAPIADPRYHR